MEIYILLFYLVILSVYDCREKQVPGVLLFIGVVVAVISLLIVVIDGQQVWYRILGLLPGLFLLLVAFVTKKAGYADGIVLAVMGMVLGYQKTMILFCISLLLISVISVLLLFLHKVNGRTRLPYLPFLTVTYVIQQICHL